MAIIHWSLDRNQALVHAPIAQLVERTAVNREVSGSNPLGSGPLHSPISGSDNVIYFTYKNVNIIKEQMLW